MAQITLETPFACSNTSGRQTFHRSNKSNCSVIPFELIASLPALSKSSLSGPDRCIWHVPCHISIRIYPCFFSQNFCKICGNFIISGPIFYFPHQFFHHSHNTVIGPRVLALLKEPMAPAMAEYVSVPEGRQYPCGKSRVVCRLHVLHAGIKQVSNNFASSSENLGCRDAMYAELLLKVEM